MTFWRTPVLLALILTVGWGFWIQRIGVNDHDDAVSNELIFAREPVSTIVSRNPWPDQSPLYFLVLHAVGRASESPLAIHLLNAILLTGTLVATYWLARVLSGSDAAGLTAAALGALSPAALWLVRNGRMYSIQVLLSTVALVCLLRYLERRRPGDLVAIAILSVLNIYNHFIGFLVTAVLFLPLAADAWKRRRGWLPLTFAAAGITLLAVPQIVGLLGLMQAGAPLRPELSLPGLSVAFLRRVTWFWFTNSEWGSLRIAAPTLTAVYFGALAILGGLGWFAADRRLRGVAGLAFALPLLALGLAAARLDVRDRYFVWILPVLWAIVAVGAVGRLPALHSRVTGRERLNGVRAALLLAVVVCSSWLLWNKLPQRYPQWTKLMTGLQRVYRPSMAVYMRPGPSTGTPRFLGSFLDLPSGLRHIRDLTPATAGEFERELDAGRDFIFLVHAMLVNDEQHRRTRLLEERGYRNTIFPVWGARAEIFTQDEFDGFTRRQRIETGASPDAVDAWARRRLAEQSTGSPAAAALNRALVARAHPDGTIQESQVFASQRGEDESWRLGPADWEVVEEASMASGGVSRDMIFAHPATDSMLVVAFPAVAMKNSLDVEYGIADSGVRNRAGADVEISMFVNGVRKAALVCPNAAGWKMRRLDTSAFHGTAADVVMLISTRNDHGRHFGFRLETSAGAAPAVVTLGADRSLKDALDQLRVYRIAGSRQLEGSWNARPVAAADLHEAAGPDQAGALRSRWTLGVAPWDAVGLTRQQSNGAMRDGLWAHPKEGTRLVIEVARLSTSDTLHGYFGLTELAVERATEDGVTAPVRIQIALDGTVIVAGEAERVRGWYEFDVPAGDADGDSSLRIEITSADDSWAHFVFDLWSR